MIKLRFFKMIVNEFELKFLTTSHMIRGESDCFSLLYLIFVSNEEEGKGKCDETRPK